MLKFLLSDFRLRTAQVVVDLGLLALHQLILDPCDLDAVFLEVEANVVPVPFLGKFQTLAMSSASLPSCHLPLVLSRLVRVDFGYMATKCHRSFEPLRAVLALEFQLCYSVDRG